MLAVANNSGAKIAASAVFSSHAGATRKRKKSKLSAAYYERPSMRGIERIFGVSRHTVAVWLQKKPNHSPR